MKKTKSPSTTFNRDNAYFLRWRYDQRWSTDQRVFYGVVTLGTAYSRMCGTTAVILCFRRATDSEFAEKISDIDNGNDIRWKVMSHQDSKKYFM